VNPADLAIAQYTNLLQRYRKTLDLMSDKAFGDLDRLLAEAERYAAAIQAHAAGEGVVVDLGTGAGLPGVVVAARLAPRPVWWVERRRRRSAFLTQVAAGAGLVNVRVVADDVRNLKPPAEGVAAISAQAVAKFDQVAALTRHLWGSKVLLVSRKGPDWQDEVAALRAHGVAAQGGTARVEVVVAEPLEGRGTLVAVEVSGG
jgi:16S rRNA (guanine527-N7)-methyltransferase